MILSGFADLESAHIAGRLGAAAVLHKPVLVDELLGVMRRVASSTIAHQAPAVDSRGVSVGETLGSAILRAGAPSSVAERWALNVWKARESPGDLRTLSQWAHFVGVSRSTLKETSRLLGIHPHDARDLMRVLRVLVQAVRYRCNPEALLDVSDSRTMRALFGRAGIDSAVKLPISVDALFARQQFVPPGNRGLDVLRALAARSNGSDQSR